MAVAEAPPIGRSPGELLWLRLRRDRAAMAALVTIGLIALAALAGPVLADAAGLPPPERIAPNELDRDGLPTGPSASHPMGVDGLGRDVLSRLAHGTPLTLAIALGATCLALVIGVVVGLAAGLLGGAVDAVLSRLLELVLCFPLLLLALGLATACSGEAGCLGGLVHPSAGLTAAVIGLSSWPHAARLVRGQAIALRERDYVLAAQALGASRRWIAFREVLPNLLPVLLAFAAFSLPASILFEAGLAYLGVGVPGGRATWGTMLADSLPLVEEAWWMFAVPAACIMGTALALTVLADSLQDALGRSVRLVRRPL